MIGEILVKRADNKGRILISSFKGKDIYLVNLGSGYFVTGNKEVAEEVSKNASKAFSDEFLKLIEELSPEEIEDIIEKETVNKIGQ
ncbi:VapB-type antitoxin [Acidianus ambivalens]|uniref:VapB-type antitoxin n=1 Tax=Acidianus ambivalens TaxID=2283 RepID=A0A650CUR6_ACIAM|nr:VapB-type antitoxin [Acidianus ambivalens]MQL55936.1 VapB-type antitoxin [Acidianus ambivalens]QGR21503.1 VapB-type antitoxin [Acidianus ambivalens]